MILEPTYDTLDEIPAEFQPLYTEKAGKYEFTGVKGIKTQADVNALSTSLVKEREAHKATKTAYAPLAGRDINEVVTLLDRIPELEAAAAGKLDEKAIEQVVNTRVQAKIAPLEREKNLLTTQLNESKQTIDQLQGKDRTRSIHDTIRAAATKAGLLPDAVEDALILGERVLERDESGAVVVKADAGFTQGVDATVWLTELRGKRPHWWGPSEGGGSTGSNGKTGGTNPWTDANWNMTEQGNIYKADPKRAEQLAKSAGTSIGGARPAKK